ncbi:ABC transporter ATP-binding protein [Marinifilum sp.]|uniref:ABC transporter ATP-binding protein n=1 Tax=Marinifilum sp. TaxID=2033137 RepID=UPI003BAD6B92
MYRFLEERLALSVQGAKDFTKGVFFTTLLNMALMLPAIYVFMFLEDFLRPIIDPSGIHPKGLFWYYILIGISFMLVSWFIALLQYRSNYTKVYDESANRRISLAEKLRTLPLAFFGEKNLSDLTSTIMEDSTELEHTFSHAVPQLFASFISLGLIALGLFIYNWQLSLALFWVVPFAFFIILLSKKILHKENQKHYLKKRDVTEHIQEGIDTIQEIKSYSLEDAYLYKLNLKLEAYEKQLMHGELIAGAMVNGSHAFLKLGMASVIIVGAEILVSGTLDVFTYLIFLIVASRIFDPINEVFNNITALYYLDIRINRMKEMNSLPIQNGNSEFIPVNYDIAFENVDFSYEKGKQTLKNVSFIAKQGEITALIGPSGGGKSTVAKLAARFWDINSGKIYLGGKDISRVDPEVLLQYYSVVFQDVVLFNTTIEDNIRVGKRNASEEEIKRVAQLAQCDDFISKMPDGYKTIIGENGETLSGGERQRISIARALLKNAPIVLLDEATASLDVENETKIQSGISALIKNKTVIIIAHRMRTIANADQIVVLENGGVVERGDPEFLKMKHGVFAKMLEKQLN